MHLSISLPRVGRAAGRILLLTATLTLLIPPRPIDLTGLNLVSMPPALVAVSTPPAPIALRQAQELLLSFEANRGQTDPQVQFLARGRGLTLFLTQRDAVLVLLGAAGEPGRTLPGAAVRIIPIAANPAPTLMALQPLPGRVNYFRGNDPARWRTDVPTYAQVRYQELYPGIDLVFYGTQRRLEYDFVLAPGADPDRIALRFEGVQGLRIDGKGDLMLQVAGREIRQARPVAYQEIAGARRPVAARYVLRGPREVGLDLGAYQASRPLVIDPVLAYSTFLGGAANEDGLSIALDSSGNAYITGETASADFPTTAGALDPTFNGSRDVFVTKLNPTGTALAYSTYLGGGNASDGYAIAVDAGGNAYVAGDTRAADFPTTGGVFDPTANGGRDAFVVKLNPTGSALVYSTYLGGASDDAARGIAIDATGNVTVTGWTPSADFPTTAGAFDTSYNGGTSDAFVTRLNAAGTALLYSTYLGSADLDRGRAITIDAGGNAYVAGTTRGGDFPTTAGVFDQTFNGATDLFVAKLSAAGDALVFSTYLGGSSDDGVNGTPVTVDGSGNVYVGGASYSANFPTTMGAYDTVLAGERDGFVSKLSADGTALLYSTLLGGSLMDEVLGLKLDSAGNFYVTGYTSSPDFPTVDAFQATFDVVTSGFIAKFNAAGAALLYSSYFGGAGDDGGFSLVLDPARTAYVTGWTTSADFPVTSGSFDTTYGGAYDAIVMRIATPSFADVPLADWGYTWIEAIYHRGITSGCATGPLRYCPDNQVTRREMAVFLIRGRGESAPSGCAGTFADVPASDWGCPWVERLYALGVTAGCATSPLRYCPDNQATRREMAVFLNRAAGQAACSGCAQSFSDVPPSDWGFGWIERLYQRGITAGCATSPLRYCPDNNVTRREMAVFLIRNFFP